MPGVGLADYLAVFWPVDRQANENQLASFDASFLLPLHQRIPAKSIQFYSEVGGEDAAGLSSYRPMVGVCINDLFRTGRTDVRIEYVDNHDVRRSDLFYRHHTYPYRYQGRVIGHHMGTDARDIFVRLTHYITADVILGLEYNKETSDPVGTARQSAEYFGFDLAFFTCRRWRLRTGYRYERTANTPAFNGDNHIFDLNVIYDF
jgi:hypothetical protein